MTEPTLADFIAWAKVCGHYQVTDMHENFLKFLERQKEREEAK